MQLIQNVHYSSSHGLWGSPGLKMPIHAHFFRQTILTGKLGQTARLTSFLVCDQGSLGHRSVHARLQVSVCSGCDLCHYG